MKKALSVILILSMLAGLTACGLSAGEDIPGQSSPAFDAGKTPVSTGGLNLEEDIQGEITIACYEGMTYENIIQEAKEKFEAKYPGTTIHFESFSKPPEIKTMEKDGMSLAVVTMENDPQAESDYIFKAGNDIMSGQGADIYAMDILPYYKYAGGGYLEDLSKYLDTDPEINLGDYSINILDAVKYDGRQYIIPLAYSFDLFTYDTDILGDQAKELESGDTLKGILEKTKAFVDMYNEGNQEPVKLISYDKQQLFMSLFQSAYKNFVNYEGKTASFESGEFLGLLETAAYYADNGYIPESLFGLNMEEGEAFTFDAFEALGDNRYMLGTDSSYGLFYMLYEGSGMVRFTTTSASASGHEPGGLMANDHGGIEASIPLSLGMNANSKNKRLAWEFLKFLLGEEMQTSMNIHGLPINNNARDEMSRLQVTEELYLSPEERTKGALTGDQQALYDEYVSYIDGFSSQINEYIPMDHTIYTIVNEESGNFFDGAKSAEDAARTIQNKVTLYLNE